MEEDRGSDHDCCRVVGLLRPSSPSDNKVSALVSSMLARLHSLQQRSGENQLRDDHRGALKSDGSPSAVLEVVELDNLGIDQVGERGQESLEVGEEGRIIERPLRAGL